MHRSPGVFFDHDSGKSHASGKYLFNARMIPYRGSWLDFEFDIKDKINFRIDLRRKMPAGILLKALGLNVQGILDRFYERRTYRFGKDGLQVKFVPEQFLGSRAATTIKVGGKRIVAEGKKFTPVAIKRMTEEKVDWIDVPEEAVIGEVAAEPIVVAGGEILVDHNVEITAETLAAMQGAGIQQFDCLFIDTFRRGPWLADTLRLDTVQSKEEAQVEIYRMMRPGEPPTLENARNLLRGLFFDPKRYDLTKVGRYKLNQRLGVEVPEDPRVLTTEDIVALVRRLLDLPVKLGVPEDSKDFAAEAMRLTDGRGVDLILDAVGRPTFEGGLACMAPFGHLILYGSAGGAPAPLDPMRLFAKSLNVTPAQVQAMMATQLPAMTALLQGLPQMRTDFSALIGLMRANVPVFAQVPSGLAHYKPLVDTMQGNVGDFKQINSLPNFNLFTWFFVIPGILLAFLAGYEIVQRVRVNAKVAPLGGDFGITTLFEGMGGDEIVQGHYLLVLFARAIDQMAGKFRKRLGPWEHAPLLLAEMTDDYGIDPRPCFGSSFAQLTIARVEREPCSNPRRFQNRLPQLDIFVGQLRKREPHL